MAENLTTVLSTPTKKVTISRDKPAVIIGERINPTGRKRVLQALREGDFEMVRRDAVAQVEAGAAVLDVNAGVPGADEPALLLRVLQEVTSVTDVPLSIDTANTKALEVALSAYEGKPLVNSVTGEKKSLDAVLPLVAEHGAAVIGLCMGEDGIPGTPEGRLKVAERIIERAVKLGISLEDVVIDPLVMTMGADYRAGYVTMKTVELVVEKFGVNVTMGASNASFGLPDRKALNAAYLAMAIYAGVTCPITNPLIPEICVTVLAADLILGRDEFGMNWIKAYRQREKGR